MATEGSTDTAALSLTARANLWTVPIAPWLSILKAARGYAIAASIAPGGSGSRRSHTAPAMSADCQTRIFSLG